MSLARKIQPILAIAVCLTVGSTLVSVLEAQQYSPPAPQLFQPRVRAVSGRFAQRMMTPTFARTPMLAFQDPQSSPQQQPLESIQGETYVEGSEITSIPGEEIILEDGAYFEDGGYIDGGYEDCGDCHPLGCHRCGPAIDPRDCGIPEDCWLNGMGGLLCNTEFFTGVQGFRNQVFGEASIFEQNSGHFGFHGGFNTGLPLYKLTCGLVTGQVGFNFVGSNYRTNDFFPTGDRRQTFFTGGLFRRVDYGLQFGAVADVLHEEYYVDKDVIQVRSELSYVWPVGHSIGFRFARHVQDAQGEFPLRLREINSQSINWYKLFLRTACSGGGYCDFFVGRTDERHTLVGAKYDLPLGVKSGLQTGFAYMLPDSELAFTENDAWNVYMRVSFRPRGRDWYKFYHRPLFDVADNGSMIISQN